MNHETYSHRYADIILNADYEIKREIEEVIKEIKMGAVEERYFKENDARVKKSAKPAMGKQATINLMFKEAFVNRGWEFEKNVFNDPGNDLAIDFWKRSVGVDIAFNHRSFIGGDLLRLQAGAEVKNMIIMGVYVCPTKEFAKIVSPKDASSMVSYERARWYLENFYSVLTVPILLLGLSQ